MKRVALAAVITCTACEPVTYQARTPAWVDDTATLGAPPRVTIADGYREVAAKIVTAARADRGAYTKLAELTDQVGHRLAGSTALDNAIAWAVQSMKTDGLDVRTEKVTGVQHWVRGVEEVAITSPVARPLRVIALGGSVSTPKGGIVAPLVVVHDWKELDTKAEAIKGAIVLYNVAMPAWSAEHGSGYGATVEYRGRGAIEASRRGAVAALVRSVTARSLTTLHTGAMKYETGVAKIPSGAMTVEDVELLDRLVAKSKVSLQLRLEPKQLPDIESANVIGELRGAEKPDEIVLISAHLDSWDVGQGAHDDGAGVVTMMQALRVLKQLGLVPRRTIRVVLFTNEENGLRGARSYAETHASELSHHVLALEADSGGFAPRGFTIEHDDADAAKRARVRIADITTLLSSIGASRVTAGGGGADIAFMKAAGVPQAGLEVDSRAYFDYHHTDADTLDKVDPANLADMVAAVAVLAFVVADMPARVDAP